MESIGIWVILGLIILAHLFMAYFVSIELAEYPLLNTSSKFIWYIVVWFLPVIGTLMAYRKLQIKWNSKAKTGAASQAEWYAGHENDSHGGSSD